MSKIFRLGSGGQSNAAPQKNQGGNAGGNNAPKFEKIRNQDWFRILFSGAVSALVYFVILNFMPSFSEPWQKHLVTLFASVIFFFFIGAAQKEPGTLADAILSFLALIFILQMAINYL